MEWLVMQFVTITMTIFLEKGISEKLYKKQAKLIVDMQLIH